MAFPLCERSFCAVPITATKAVGFAARSHGAFRATYTTRTTMVSTARLMQPVPISGQPAARRLLSTTPALQARLVMRPRRPYEFTQVVQLSDGSTFTMRTTSPHPLHRSSKDTRNHIIWQPSEKSLRNVEVDEAGRLAAFRNRFGRGWDAAAPPTEGTEGGKATGKVDDKAATGPAAVAEAAAADEGADMLADLLSGYAAKEEPLKRGGLSAKEQAKKDKKKK